MFLPRGSYFYLVDETVDDVVAVFSLEHCADELAVISYDHALRCAHAIDDVASGLALVDAADRPLEPEVVARVGRAGRLHRGGSLGTDRVLGFLSSLVMAALVGWPAWGWLAG